MILDMISKKMIFTVNLFTNKDRIFPKYVPFEWPIDAKVIMTQILSDFTSFKEFENVF